MKFCSRYLKFSADLGITIFLWLYFLLGYLFFFSPLYLVVFFFSKNRQESFQNLNHRFLKSFLFLMRTIIPGLKFSIDDRIPEIRSSIIICNHKSYLDPILFVALFQKHTTIVKNTFFRVPIFGQVINASGYIPSQGQGRLSSLLLQRIKNVKDYLDAGGILFVFPEGTRSRDGQIGDFNAGAFKISRRCNVPIQVLVVSNTEKLFRPGKFLFNTCVPNQIEIKWIDTINPGETADSISEQVAAVKKAMYTALDFSKTEDQD